MAGFASHGPTRSAMQKKVVKVFLSLGDVKHVEEDAVTETGYSIDALLQYKT